MAAPAREWLDRALALAEDAAGPAPEADATAAAATAHRGGEAGPAPRRMPAWELRFAEAGRRCGPEHADAARVLLLSAARPAPGTVARLYGQGSAAERRAVLAALPYLTGGPEALPLVEDALRTNDTRLVAAAVGPYAAAHLDAHAWRHAVLKCLFTGVPVAAVAALAERAGGDGELARMLGDYAEERRAAGRAVPADLFEVLRLTGGLTGGPAGTATAQHPAAPGPPPAREAAPAAPPPADQASPGTPTALKAPSTGEES
nr:EboA domain-containing protein [Streptomyces sp. TS71-3]